MRFNHIPYIENEFPHIECKRCSVHLANLVFKDFYKHIKIVKEAVDATKDAVNFIYGHQKSLALFRAQGETEIVRWCTTRFGTVYETCASVLDHMTSLRKCVVEPGWVPWSKKQKYKKEADATRELFLSEQYLCLDWNNQ